MYVCARSVFLATGVKYRYISQENYRTIGMDVVVPMATQRVPCCKVAAEDATPVVFDRSNQGEFHYMSTGYFSPVMFEGTEFTSAEHCYQCQKYLQDGHRYTQVRHSRTPKHAKKIGEAHTPEGFNHIVAMMCTLKAKFSNPKLEFLLVSTHPRKIEFRVNDGDAMDAVWGCNSKGYGSNKLGTMLMDPRSILVMQRSEDPRLGATSEDPTLSQIESKL